MDKWTHNFDKVISPASTHYINGSVSNMKIGTNVGLSKKPNSNWSHTEQASKGCCFIWLWMQHEEAIQMKWNRDIIQMKVVKLSPSEKLITVTWQTSFQSRLNYNYEHFCFVLTYLYREPNCLHKHYFFKIHIKITAPVLKEYTIK